MEVKLISKLIFTMATIIVASSSNCIYSDEKQLIEQALGLNIQTTFSIPSIRGENATVHTIGEDAYIIILDGMTSCQADFGVPPFGENSTGSAREVRVNVPRCANPLAIGPPYASEIIECETASNDYDICKSSAKNPVFVARICKMPKSLYMGKSVVRAFSDARVSIPYINNLIDHVWDLLPPYIAVCTIAFVILMKIMRVGPNLSWRTMTFLSYALLVMWVIISVEKAVACTELRDLSVKEVQGKTDATFMIDSRGCVMIRVDNDADSAPFIIQLGEAVDESGFMFDKILPKHFETSVISKSPCPTFSTPHPNCNPKNKPISCTSAIVTKGWSGGCFFGDSPSNICTCVELLAGDDDPDAYGWSFRLQQFQPSAKLSIMSKLGGEEHVLTDLKIGPGEVRSMVKGIGEFSINCNTQTQIHQPINYLFAFKHGGTYQLFGTGSSPEQLLDYPWSTGRGKPVQDQYGHVLFGAATKNTITYTLQEAGDEPQTWMDRLASEVHLDGIIELNRDELVIMNYSTPLRSICTMTLTKRVKVTKKNTCTSIQLTHQDNTIMLEAQQDCITTIHSAQCLLTHQVVPITKETPVFVGYKCQGKKGKACVGDSCITIGVDKTYAEMFRDIADDWATRYAHFQIGEGITPCGLVASCRNLINQLLKSLNVPVMFAPAIAGICLIVSLLSLNFKGMAIALPLLLIYGAQFGDCYSIGENVDEIMHEADLHMQVQELTQQVKILTARSNADKPEGDAFADAWLMLTGLEYRNGYYALVAGTMTDYRWQTRFGVKINPARWLTDGASDVLVDTTSLPFGLTVAVAFVSKSIREKYPMDSIVEAVRQGSTSEPRAYFGYSVDLNRKDKQMMASEIRLYDDYLQPGTCGEAGEVCSCTWYTPNGTISTHWKNQQEYNDEADKRAAVDKWAKERSYKLIWIIPLSKVTVSERVSWVSLHYTEQMIEGVNMRVLKPCPTSFKVYNGQCLNSRGGS